MFNFFLYFVMGLFMLVCVLMILLVLIQKGRGGGLSGAFGGAGGNTAFGSKTGDVLTWATSVFFGVFLILAVTMNILARHTAAPAPGNTITIPAAPNNTAPPQSPIPGN
jgi:preprotein translocase subunit SecG